MLNRWISRIVCWLDDRYDERHVDSLYRDRVERGSAMLDAAQPGWHDRVNLRELNMASIKRCVLGQVYGSYRVGCKALDVLFTSVQRACGFVDDNSARLRILTGCWRRAIRRRRRNTPDLASSEVSTLIES